MRRTCAFKALLAEAETQRLARINANRERVSKLYGERTDDEIDDILKAEDEIAKCAGCKGLPCQKRGGSESVPTVCVERGHVVIRSDSCAVSQAAFVQRRLANRLRSSRIPDAYIGKTFADYVTDKNNEKAVAWAKTALQTGKGAFLFGDCGTGKTFLASIVAQEFIRAGKPTVFIKVPALLANIRDTFNGKSKFSEAELMQEVSEAKLLVLDDFGMEKPTKFVGTTLCQIIDARYATPNLTTIITSNYPPEGVRDELNNAVDGANYNGSRIYDRCMQCCPPIKLKGTSRRNWQ